MKQKYFIPLVFILIALNQSLPVSASETGGDNAIVMISADTDLSTAGYYRLSWKSQPADASDTPIFEVQESSSLVFDDARPIYRGADMATVISGKSNGEYYYRVKMVRVDAQNSSPQQWSDSIKVSVQHHGIGKAFGFFGVGLVVFILTLVTILKGSRDQ